MKNTITLASKTTARGTWHAWADGLGLLAEGDIDGIRTSGALSAARCGGRVASLGRLHGTRWGQAIDAVEPDAVVTSYDTPIAVLVRGRWFMPEVKHSTTTCSHQSKVRRATNAIMVQDADTMLALVAGGPVAETAWVLIGDGMAPTAALAAAAALEGVAA
jgi:hypothetical protein